MTGAISTARHFYFYQKERFPLIVLGLSLLPAIVSSGAVVGAQVDSRFVLTALGISLAYLLHIRVIDEFRDYAHDLEHHADRPVSSGAITLAELQRVDWLALLVMGVVSAYAGFQALLVAGVMVLYSHVARREFYMGARFRRHFFLYNAVNLIQILLLQLLVYTIADPTFSFTTLIVVHFLFTSTGTIIFEFLRKVKNPGADGSGKDTYTYYLGLNTALLVYAILAALNITLFANAMALMVSSIVYWLPVAVVLAGGAFGTLLVHLVARVERTNKLMQLSFIVMYGGYNILLFLAI